MLGTVVGAGAAQGVRLARPGSGTPLGQVDDLTRDPGAYVGAWTVGTEKKGWGSKENIALQPREEQGVRMGCSERTTVRARIGVWALACRPPACARVGVVPADCVQGTALLLVRQV